jgi:hypothetical protein
VRDDAYFSKYVPYTASYSTIATLRNTEATAHIIETALHQHRFAHPLVYGNLGMNNAGARCEIK